MRRSTENSSTKVQELVKKRFNVIKSPDSLVVALAGNPNTGKSTIFNTLTGLKQHTGNWPGKTVVQAQGSFLVGSQKYTIVDLPGTYSLLANSVEETVARDFLCFGRPEAAIVVVDATCLERNLNLVLQIMEITSKVVVSINLMDEAQRKGISIDNKKLESQLGVPVVPTVARIGQGIEELVQMVHKVARNEVIPKPRIVCYDPDIEDAVAEMTPNLEKILDGRFNPRWVALRIIAGDSNLINQIFEACEVSLPWAQ
ncbi:MAG: FeoB small GTPase domain-containing protein [Bacillota bacterium]